MRRIVIHLDRRTPTARFDRLGPLVVPVFNYFQAALVLFDDGQLQAGDVVGVAHEMLATGDYTLDTLANSLQELLRRGRIDRAIARRGWPSRRRRSSTPGAPSGSVLPPHRGDRLDLRRVACAPSGSTPSPSRRPSRGASTTNGSSPKKSSIVGVAPGGATMIERELTYCRICEAACGLVGVRDARGELVDLEPDREHPTSAGFACAKGTRFLEVARHPTRLLSPMLREGRGGALRPVSWDLALSDAGARLADVVRRHGPHAVAVYYGNPIAFNTLGAAGMLGFVRALGTRNVYGAGSQDCANKFAGAELVHGSVAIHPIPDLERCELAVFFGTNPAVSQTKLFHLEGGTPMLKKILARGGEIVWLDPRKTESARMGTHLPIRPGTDVFLLLALLGLLGEGAQDDERTDGLEALLAVARGWTPERAATVTGLPATEIRALAARIAGARRGVAHGRRGEPGRLRHARLRGAARPGLRHRQPGPRRRAALPSAGGGWGASPAQPRPRWGDGAESGGRLPAGGGRAAGRDPRRRDLLTPGDEQVARWW